jgi:hypothetical protein
MKTKHTTACAALRRGKQTLLAVALVGSLASTTTLVAQNSTNAVDTAKPAESPERPPYRPWTVGVEAGTDGIFGGFGSWRFSDHLGVRVGVDYAQASFNNLGVAGIHYNAKLQLLSEPIVLDFYPWQKHSFHLGLGMLINQNELSGTASENGTIVIGGQPLPVTPGSLTMKIHQQPVNPYFTVGGTFFYFDHAHHVGFGGELGVAYTEDAEASLNHSGPSNPVIASALQNAKDRLQHYGNQYTWWPVAKLAVTYSF